MHPLDPEMKRGACQGTPNFIANAQPNNTIPAEQISQPKTAVIGENPAAVVLYLQRRFGLLPTAMEVLSKELTREIVRRRRLKREIDSGSAR